MKAEWVDLVVVVAFATTGISGPFGAVLWGTYLGTRLVLWLGDS